MIPFWDTRVGADLTVARQQPASAAEALQQKITTGEQQSSGAAWAAMTAPGVGSIWDKTAIEARVDPSQEQSRLGTSLSKSVPLDERTSLTLQNGSSVTQQGIAAIPGITGHQARNYAMDQSAQAEHRRHRHQSHRRPDPVLHATTNGCARSAPSKNCSAASASPARSARRCRARANKSISRGLQEQLVTLSSPRRRGPIASVGCLRRLGPLRVPQQASVFMGPRRSLSSGRQ